MVRVRVELGPDADHEAAVHRVDVVQHLFRIRIAGRVELVAPPLVRQPVLPVLDDVVDRNLPLAELRERAHEFLLRGIALPALPEAEGPLRIQGGLAGEGAVAADNLVIIGTRHEVEVQLGLELRPEAQAGLVLRALGHGDLQAEVGNAAVGLPGHLDGLPFARLEMDLVAEAVGVPGRTPAAGHHFLAADFRGLEAGVVLGEIVIALHRRLDFAFEGHDGALERQLGQVADQPLVVVLQRFLALDERLAAGDIGSRQCAFDAVLVIELEHLAQLLEGVGIAPTAPGISVEKQAIALGRDHERDADLGIVLVEFLVEALVVELARLLLAEAVEGLVGGGVEDHLRGEGLLAFHLDGCESHLAALAGGQERLAGGVRERQLPGGRVHGGGHGRCGHLHEAAFRRHGEGRLFLHGKHDEALPVVELLVRGRGHADDLLAQHLEPDLFRRFDKLTGRFLSLSKDRRLELHGHGIALHGILFRATGEGNERDSRRKEENLGKTHRSMG